MYSGVSIPADALQTAPQPAPHLNPHETQGAVLRELYRTNDLLRPFRTPENIQQWAAWPDPIVENGTPVKQVYLSDSRTAHNYVPSIDVIVRALGALHEKGLIMADKDLHQVALTEAGRVVIDQLPREQRPEQAQQIVYGGFRDRD